MMRIRWRMRLSWGSGTDMCVAQVLQNRGPRRLSPPARVLSKSHDTGACVRVRVCVCVCAYVHVRV